MGIDMTNWSMAFDLTKKTYDLTASFGDSSSILDQITKLDGSDDQLSCEQLVQKSKEALKQVSGCSDQSDAMPISPAQIVTSQEMASRTTASQFERFQICLNCHGTGGPAGFDLKLSSESDFKNQLRSTPGLAEDIQDHLRGQRKDGTNVLKMPLGIDLGADAGPMIQYIDTLK
jgi:hypothetical protein